MMTETILPKTFATLIAILGALLVVMLATPAGAEPSPAAGATSPAAEAFEAPTPFTAAIDVRRLTRVASR